MFDKMKPKRDLLCKLAALSRSSASKGRFGHHAYRPDRPNCPPFWVLVTARRHSAQNARLQIDAHREGLFSRSELVRQIDGQIRIGIFAFADAELASKRMARKLAHAALAALVIVGVGLPAHFRIQVSPCRKF